MTSPRADRHLYVLGGPSDHLGYLNCERISERSHIHGWSVDAHFHEGLAQLFVFDAGKVEAQLDYAHTSIQGPALVWLPALCSHAFDYEPGMEGWVITVPTTDLAELVSEAPYYDHWIDRSQLVVGKEQVPVLAEAIELARKFQSLVEDPETTDHTVAAVARLLSVTPTHLSRSVKAVTGRTASEVLMDQLLLRSKRKLAFTDQSVSDIAFDLGFSSPSYFSRFFSAQTGETPRNFRKTVRNR